MKDRISELKERFSKELAAVSDQKSLEEAVYEEAVEALEKIGFEKVI